MEEIRDRAQGLYVGLGAGNLLGWHWEGQDPGWIAAATDRGVREIVSEPGFADDDDLGQAIILTDAAAGGDLEIDDFCRRFWERGRDQRRRDRQSDPERVGALRQRAAANAVLQLPARRPGRL